MELMEKMTAGKNERLSPYQWMERHFLPGRFHRIGLLYWICT